MKVSLFCTAGPRKNLSNQLLACSMVEDLELHINGLSQNPEFARLMKDLKVQTIDHGWMEKSQYTSVIREMDLGLQVTFAETFNYVVVEHFVQGIPVVCSHMIPVAAWDKRLDPLLVNRADSPEDIAQTIKRVYADRENLSSLVRQSVKDLAIRNNAALKERLQI